MLFDVGSAPRTESLNAAAVVQPSAHRHGFYLLVLVGISRQQLFNLIFVRLAQPLCVFQPVSEILNTGRLLPETY